MIDNKYGWAADEFAEVSLGDKRLNARLIKLCDRFSDAPESSINQACADWMETKAAYRFFQNDSVNVEDILMAHRRKTSERLKKHNTVLAIQDTSYIVYTKHTKTEGLGKMTMTKGKHIAKIYSHGLMMHTCLAVTTNGLPLGLLDQNIYVRQLRPEHERRGKGSRSLQDSIPVEKKESYRWLEALTAASDAVDGTRVVTVCDRESDFYDFFKRSDQIQAPVLIRASQNRTVNRNTRYEEKDVDKLWGYMNKQTVAGSYTIDIPSKRKTKHNESSEARTAHVVVKFGSFQMNPPRNNPKHKTEVLPDIEMHAVHVLETDAPKGIKPVEWMLLTNISITSFDEACEKIRWYALRWRIEMYFKVLKSGFRVEACRLSTAERLTRYLAVMSVVAWRLFMITLIARTDADTPCTNFMTKQEWAVLYLKTNRNKKLPSTPPTIGQAVNWVARLGGYLARKSDGPPGTITLWRGWKRLTDLTEGWNLADQL